MDSNGGSTALAAGNQSMVLVDLHQVIDKELLECAPGPVNQSVVSVDPHPVFGGIGEESFDIFNAPAGKPAEVIETPDNGSAVVCDGVSTLPRFT